MNATIGDRIKLARENVALSQTELAEKIGVSKQTLYKYENNIVTNIPSDKIELIANFTNVSPSHLMGWEPKQQHIAPATGVEGSRAIRLPVLGAIAGGVPIEATENLIDPDDPDTWEEIPAEWQQHGEYLCLKVEGHSMEPQIRNGDIAILKRTYEWHPGKVMAVYVNGYKATLKLIRRDPAGNITLQPFNTTYEAEFYTPQEQQEIPVCPLGVMVELRQKW